MVEKLRNRFLHVSEFNNLLNLFLLIYISVDSLNFRQTIIGLHHHETKDLLIQLFYFTFLVVITAIQVLIFHKKYINQFVWKSGSDRTNIQRQNSVDVQSGSEDGDKTILEKVKFSHFYHGFFENVEKNIRNFISDGSRH